MDKYSHLLPKTKSQVHKVVANIENCLQTEGAELIDVRFHKLRNILNISTDQCKQWQNPFKDKYIDENVIDSKTWESIKQSIDTMTRVLKIDKNNLKQAMKQSIENGHNKFDNIRSHLNALNPLNSSKDVSSLAFNHVMIEIIALETMQKILQIVRIFNFNFFSDLFRMRKYFFYNNFSFDFE